MILKLIHGYCNLIIPKVNINLDLLVIISLICRIYVFVLHNELHYATTKATYTKSRDLLLKSHTKTDVERLVKIKI